MEGGAPPPPPGPDERFLCPPPPPGPDERFLGGQSNSIAFGKSTSQRIYPKQQTPKIE